MTNPIEKVWIEGKVNSVPRLFILRKKNLCERCYFVRPERMTRALQLLMAWAQQNPLPEIVEADYA